MADEQTNMQNPAYYLIKNAKIGSIVPVVEALPYALEPVEYFSRLTGNGNKKNCILFESADIVPKYGEKSLGSADPCLKIIGKNENFEIIALNDLGARFVDFLKNDFDFCDEVEYKKDRIKGKLESKKKFASEEERLKQTNHADIIRKIAFKFKPALKTFTLSPYAGLFGCISYDFIGQFEELPKNKRDITKDPDYALYFLDNLFLIDHKENKTFFVANALIMGGKHNAYEECLFKIKDYKNAINNEKSINNKNAINKKAPLKKNFSAKVKIKSDTTKKEFIRLVKKLKEHITAGDVYQAVLSRTISADFNKEPFDVYKKLRELNPSPYMFYVNMNNGDGVLLGASPEMCIKVEGGESKKVVNCEAIPSLRSKLFFAQAFCESKKVVEIRPIAGTKPRGLIGNKLDIDLDSRYETELKTDKKEISEHIMLVDLARNDIAKISKPGTRYVDEPFVVEKYSHVQHLVSNIRGILKDDLDALHAYLATMNMGTLTGAPKIEAMGLLRIHEKTKRGFYGGAVCYITPGGELDSAIAIRSIRIKGSKAYIRAGAGIVHDSDPESEFMETERKAYACLKAIELA